MSSLNGSAQKVISNHNDHDFSVYMYVTLTSNCKILLMTIFAMYYVIHSLMLCTIRSNKLTRQSLVIILYKVNNSKYLTVCCDIMTDI